MAGAKSPRWNKPRMSKGGQVGRCGLNVGLWAEGTGESLRRCWDWTTPVTF